MNLSKIKTYIGFAKKSRQIIYGLDSIKEKKAYIIVYSEGLSESSKNGCVKAAIKSGCKTYQISDDDMLELMNIEKIKAFAITNSELAKAIESNM